MPRRHLNPGFESVTPSVRRGERNVSAPAAKKVLSAIERFTVQEKKQPANQVSQFGQSSPTFLKRGHKLTYAAVFAFTLVLYARPSEFYPSPVTNSLALIIGIITLALFVPTQFALEGGVTAPIREVHLVALFGLIGLINIPLAMSPGDAWQTFTATFIRCIVIFVVMVNATRTEARLKGLWFLALGTAVWLSVGAINDYRNGLLTVEGYRVAGRGLGMFGNSNDMAMYLVTMVPISIGLLLSTRSRIVKIFLGACSALMVAGIVVSYSRGAFLGLAVVLIFLALKVGRGNRLVIVLGIILIAAAVLLLAPGNYGARVLSILVPSLDPVGSSDARRGELYRSLFLAIRHPVFGIGMGNYASQMSYRGIVTHNSYTQVAAEMGLAALVCYVALMVSPLRKLGQIVRETMDAHSHKRYFYLAIGLQGALVGYMVSSFFLSVAYTWYVFFLVAYAVCLRRLYEAETGKVVVVESRKGRKLKMADVHERQAAAI